MTTFRDLQQTISRYATGGRERRRLEPAQLAAMGDLDAVLADVGLARSQAGSLVARGGESAGLPEQMLARLGVDASRLPAVEGHPPPREGHYRPSADELRRLRAETRRREVRMLIVSSF